MNDPPARQLWQHFILLARPFSDRREERPQTLARYIHFAPLASGTRIDSGTASRPALTQRHQATERLIERIVTFEASLPKE